jgi:stress response protein YsnF
MAQTVVGFFDDAAQAQRAVEKLVDKGFDRSSVDISSGTGYDTTSTSADRHHEHESGITRFFKNLFGDDDDEADRYSRVGMRSNSIVTVHAQSSDEAERAADLLDDYGAINVNERASEYDRTGTTMASDTATDYNRDRTTNYDRDRLTDTDYNEADTRRSNMSDTGDQDTTINRIEENMEVGKRTVERGGVRVRSRIIEKPVEESIRLREERVNVERNPVDREASRDELSNFQERDIELTERAEVPVVNKEARVAEEIRVSKDVEEREETVRDTVRSTDVDVENISGNDRDITNRDTDYDATNRNTRKD